MKKRGRPPKPIDVELLKKCAERQWTTRELGAHFGIDEANLRRRFAAIIEEARENGKAKIRDLQFKRAIEGSDKMIIHLSKHYLDQHEQEKIEHSGTTTLNHGTVLILPEKEIDERNKATAGTPDKIPSDKR